MRSKSLKAHLVLPMDGPPLDGGVVTVAGERIVAVGSRPPAGATVEDLGDVALLPGLINTHTHLEFSDLAQPLGAQGMRFVEWIRRVIGRRAAADRPQETAVAQGLRESLAAGVTTICDITTADATVYAPRLEGPDVIALLEVIGFSRARRASALAAVDERLRTSQTAAGERPNVLAVGLSPHAPYTVNRELVGDLARLAQQNDLPVAMHLAESREELELLFSCSGAFHELLVERSMWEREALEPGSRPLDYLLQLAPARRLLVIHGTHLAPEEVQWLVRRRRRASLVYCPRTHSYFNRRPYRLPDFLRDGVRVVLGTDSRASSPDLSVLSEARHAARQHPNVDGMQLLQMATIHAAEALGIDESVGSITPGKRADITAIPLEAGKNEPPADAILRTGVPSVRTWYRGRPTGFP